ncbi:SH3 domain-containing protein [Pseudanabaena sp. FACHB-1277]|jgi:hypothetical protein|uniref:SH3 domain-containing protein n=1 Tax=Pseudanabaena cinerea FACHB-1277 TaxID=2949581 RepID=A0A926UVZ9_9CYAN|nr:SH3 domain-containing protein [Pseudanabaena cinerea]MBD2151876.1 SH3 domain-containing protein [Pseudanabaena cinerea FACHB-1277]
MRFPETAKSSVSLAFSLGLIAAVVAIAWNYVIVPYRRTPEKPVFSNDFKTVPAPKPLIAEIKIAPIPQPTVKATPKPNVPKNVGRVNASIGLVFRADPSQGSRSVGGADFNDRVSVIKESPDREWVLVRNETTKEEGWVRSGNITKQ